jgi:hypothetical protein
MVLIEFYNVESLVGFKEFNICFQELLRLLTRIPDCSFIKNENTKDLIIYVSEKLKLSILSEKIKYGPEENKENQEKYHKYYEKSTKTLDMELSRIIKN